MSHPIIDKLATCDGVDLDRLPAANLPSQPRRDRSLLSTSHRSVGEGEVVPRDQGVAVVAAQHQLLVGQQRFRDPDRLHATVTQLAQEPNGPSPEPEQQAGKASVTPAARRNLRRSIGECMGMLSQDVTWRVVVPELIYVSPRSRSSTIQSRGGSSLDPFSCGLSSTSTRSRVIPRVRNL